MEKSSRKKTHKFDENWRVPFTEQLVEKKGKKFLPSFARYTSVNFRLTAAFLCVAFMAIRAEGDREFFIVSRTKVRTNTNL